MVSEIRFARLPPEKQPEPRFIHIDTLALVPISTYAAKPIEDAMVL